MKRTMNLSHTLVCAALMAIAPTAHADTADGLAFLERTANPDGSFGSIPARDTDVALRALAAYEGDADPDDAHEAWLAWAEASSADFATRLLLARATLGEDLETDVDAVLAMQNPDGG